jgi:hypothetical protein
MKKLCLDNQMKCLLSKLLLVVAILILFIHNLPLFFVLLFEVLDFIKSALRKTFPFVPLDIEFVLGITVSYFFNPLWGILIFFLSVINNIIFMNVELRHITKGVRHIPLFFLISTMRNVNFFFAAFLLLTINYLLKYGLNIATGELDNFRRFPFSAINYLCATVCFYFINTVNSYLPFFI